MAKVKFEDLTQQQKDNLLKTLLVIAHANASDNVVEFSEAYTKYGAEAFEGTEITVKPDTIRFRRQYL